MQVPIILWILEQKPPASSISASNSDPQPVFKARLVLICSHYSEQAATCILVNRQYINVEKLDSVIEPNLSVEVWYRTCVLLTLFANTSGWWCNWRVVKLHLRLGFYQYNMLRLTTCIWGLVHFEGLACFQGFILYASGIKWKSFLVKTSIYLHDFFVTFNDQHLKKFLLPDSVHSDFGAL